MASNRTFTMIKPDAVRGGHIGNILQKIVEGGFKIVAMKYTKLSKESAGAFYEVHKERPFYGELVDFMSEHFMQPMLVKMQCTDQTAMKMQISNLIFTSLRLRYFKKCTLGK